MRCAESKQPQIQWLGSFVKLTIPEALSSSNGSTALSSRTIPLVLSADSDPWIAAYISDLPSFFPTIQLKNKRANQSFASKMKISSSCVRARQNSHWKMGAKMEASLNGIDAAAHSTWYTLTVPSKPLSTTKMMSISCINQSVTKWLFSKASGSACWAPELQETLLEILL